MFIIIILGLERRRLVLANVTANEWLAQQVVNAFPWDTAPRFLIRDRDRRASRPPPRVPFAMAYVIAGVAGLVGALFLWDAWKALALQAEWARGVIVEGGVVELIERPIPGPRVIAHPAVTPVVRHKTPQGERGRLVSSLGLYPSPYALGDKVAVRYLAGGHPRAELDAALAHASRRGSLLMGALFSAIALLIAIWDQVLGFLPHHP